MQMKNWYNVKRVPRIVTLTMRHAKGGFIQMYDRRGQHHVIDTTPAHAVQTPAHIGRDGVVFPIRNPR